MQRLVTLPLPSDVSLPESTGLKLTPQSPAHSLLYLTAGDADVVLPLVPPLPSYIEQLSTLGLLNITHTDTSITLHLLPKALQQQYIKRVLPIVRFAANSDQWDPKSVDYSKDWAFDAVRRNPGDSDADEYREHLEYVQQTSKLNVTLRPYQHRAVAWMLSRERELPSPAFSLRVGQFLYDPITDAVTLAGDDEDNDQEESNVWGGRGGLLCDEMGLGKTVELMQLVLCNPYTAALPPPKAPGRVCAGCRKRVEKPAARCAECAIGWHAQCIPKSPTPAQARKAKVCDGCKETMSELCHESTPPSALPPSRATLVVVPTALLRQWESELQKHVKDSLDIVIFKGTKAGYVPQRRMQVADVVLTSYTALRADVHTARAVRTPRTGGRYEKRFPPAPIPLLSLIWHRVAFDESQMLSDRGSAITEMANFLHATHRWCVTGTPIKAVLCDAENMFNTVHATYRGGAIDWRGLFAATPYPAERERLKGLMRRVMWRTSKADIGPGELDLPPQRTEVVRTRFGPVEKYHYQSLLQTVRSVIGKYQTRATMNDREMKISQDLLTTLRQACCHPQIGASGRRLLSNACRTLGLGVVKQGSRKENAIQKATKRAETPLDMNDVLEALVGKANIECLEALRSLVASTNGLAAVHLLQFSLLPAKSTILEGLVTAIQLYREVLRISEQNKHIAKLDEIQLMHVLFNLSDALKCAERKKTAVESGPQNERKASAVAKLASLGSTMREGQLTEEVDKMRQKYIYDARARLSVTTANYKDMLANLGEAPLIAAEEEDDEDESEEQVLERVRAEQRRGGATWWQIALAILLEENKGEIFLQRLVEKLVEALPGRGFGAKSLANRLASFHSLSVVVSSELQEVQASRNRFGNTLMQLPGSRPPTAQEVSESGQCIECREFGTGPKCFHCHSESLIIDVEKRLYSLQAEVHQAAVLPERFDIDEDDEGLSDGENQPARADPRTIVNGAFSSRSRIPKTTTSGSSRIRYVSELETILKGLASVVRRKKDPETVKEMTDWFHNWEELKQEHAAAIKVFQAQRSYLASMDEVNMALMRLSVREAGPVVKELTELEKRHRVPRGSLGPLRAQFEAEKAAAEAEFCTKRGSIVYLRSLQKSSEPQGEKRKHDGSSRFSNCPVCLFELNDAHTRIALMACGHVFCCDCMLAMIKKVDLKRRMESIACPTCRTRSPIDEVNFTSTTPQPSRKMSRSEDTRKSPSVDSGDTTEIEVDSIEPTSASSTESQREESSSSFYDVSETVQGHFGAKVSAALRLLRGIWKSDGSSKILIFSEWDEVLSLLAHSLTANGIFFCDGAGKVGSKNFGDVVEEFKESEYSHVILLPLRRAGAGLNMTEAEHVVLMEPSMNVSLEEQAVGRVHRIGQTHVTYVHRVLVNYTIEDQILSLGDQYREGSSDNGVGIELCDALSAISVGERRGNSPRKSVEMLDS